MKIFILLLWPVFTGHLLFAQNEVVSVIKKQGETIMQDDVVLRIENNYFTRSEIKKFHNELIYFNCLNKESVGLETMKGFFEKLQQKQADMDEILKQNFADEIEKSKFTTFYLLALKVMIFIRGYDIALSQQKTESIRDLSQITDCNRSQLIDGDVLKAMLPYFKMEEFIQKRFNIRKDYKEAQNIQSVFTFFDSIYKQYRHEIKVKNEKE
ncbi:MAG: hypothetical protein H6621_11640 [Halobacteriovoraceae bacterium]|nr:hypothetical protein [Halobacteriovoraceae bacterium]MCB9095712.1 hypothetical protein [Halobacteriovoraceae bacterium]